jgi:hypothetical protein
VTAGLGQEAEDTFDKACLVCAPGECELIHGILGFTDREACLNKEHCAIVAAQAKAKSQPVSEAPTKRAGLRKARAPPSPCKHGAATATAGHVPEKELPACVWRHKRVGHNLCTQALDDRQVLRRVSCVSASEAGVDVCLQWRHQVHRLALRRCGDEGGGACVRSVHTPALSAWNRKQRALACLLGI